MRFSECLLFVVGGKEVDGVEVVARGGDGGLSVLVQPVTKVEVGIGVLFPSCSWHVFLGPCPSSRCNVKQEGQFVHYGKERIRRNLKFRGYQKVGGTSHVIEEGDLGKKLIEVVVKLCLSKRHVISDVNDGAHILALADSNGVGPSGSD